MTINITVIITDIRTFIPIITTFKYFPKINSLSQIQLKSQKLIKSNSLSHLRHRHSKNSICNHNYSVSQGKSHIHNQNCSQGHIYVYRHSNSHCQWHSHSHNYSQNQCHCLSHSPVHCEIYMTLPQSKLELSLNVSMISMAHSITKSDLFHLLQL